MAARRFGSEAHVACPNCGEPLAAKSSIDKPLQQCASCGGITVRAGVEEWSLLRTSEKLASVVRHALLVLALGVALPLVHAAVVLGRNQPWQLQESLKCLALGLAVAGALQGGRLITRIRASRRRMRDPMYLAKLVGKEIAEASRR